MRKALLLLLIAATTFCAGAIAQPPTQVKSVAMIYRDAAGTIKANDTLKNTDTGSNGYRCGYEYDLSVNAFYNRIAGYARGSSKLQGAIDSANGPWFTLRGNQTTCPACIDSVYTFTNQATQSARWEIPRCKFPYVRLLNKSDTTQTTKITATMYYGY